MTQSMTDKTSPTFDDFKQALTETLFDSFDQGYYIGMMSGTSLDGMDAVICQFDDNHNSKIIATHSADFPPQLRDVLMALCQPNGVEQLAHPARNVILEQQPHSELEWFGWASKEYAEFASKVVNELLEKSDISADSILAIGCHGQTVRHRPHLGFTLQLVDANIIAERTGISVVSDFRRRDMAVGGQGAPLAPAFHLAQFGKATNDEPNASIHRIIVNLGGIANITVLPAGQPESVIGYDTGPANILLDAWYQHHFTSHIQNISTSKAFDTKHPEPLYDELGRWAQTGQVNSELLSQLMKHPYLHLPTPKSTGREDFNLQWLNEQIDITIAQSDANITHIKPEDVQATLTAFTAQTLVEAIKQESTLLNMASGEVVLCGGGAYNTYLMSEIAKLIPNWKVLTSETFGIAPTWVESIAFAWLARQTIMGEAGNLPAVTGANKPVVLGQVCFA